MLENALDNVVEDCVNRVGVDLNTASPSLLSHVAGINMGIARNIVAYREEHGVFTSRRQLVKVPKLGEKTFNQCAGFMRISGGDNPLDATSVHPESYGATEAMLQKLGIGKADIAGGGFKDIDEKIWQVYGVDEKPSKPKARAKGLAALAELSAGQEKPKRNMKKAIASMARDLDIGEPTLRDIIEEVKKPGRDPREDTPPVVFRNDVKSFDDLKIDMVLEGTVRNVVDFGAFVDIGVKHDGLVHISEMSKKGFVKHPMDVVSVGDTVKVRIIKIDREKERVGLSMRI